jgi:nucleoside-diphosphate-sugar epimerase
VKVVITGATGHIGRYLAQRLAGQGWNIVAASRSGLVPATTFESQAISGRVHAMALDIASETAVGTLAERLGPDVALVHLAAQHPEATAASSVDDRQRLIEVNVMGTLRVLEAARVSGASTIVYVSTFEVYGIPSGCQSATEDSETHPGSDYGVTKLAGEDHVLAFALEQNVRTAALRMPPIYGPGECLARELPSFLRSVARGERPRIYGDGDDCRDVLHVQDAALSIERALVTNCSGIYNVSDGQSHSIAELARTAMKLADMNGEPEFRPASETRFDFHVNIDKIKAELGFEPEVALIDGMQQELRWIRASAAVTA